MVEVVHGDIFDSGADALVNPVNCVGVMGKGLALEFKNRFPEMYEEYKDLCSKKVMTIGYIHVWKGLRTVLNVPTKYHWRHSSNLEDIAHISRHLRTLAEENNLKSVAVPALGCGLGNLKWEDVKPILEEELKQSPVQFYLYPPKEG